jgi:hypothetical protein
MINFLKTRKDKENIKNCGLRIADCGFFYAYFIIQAYKRHHNGCFVLLRCCGWFTDFSN